MTLFLVYLAKALRLVQLVVLVRVFWSWVDPQPRHPVVRSLFGGVDTLCQPFKVVVPHGAVAFDLGPLLLMVLLEGIQQLLAQLAMMSAGYY